MAEEYTPDTAIWPGLAELSACLCAEIVRSNLPKTCFCGVVAGEPAFDVTEEDDGFAWVRLIQVYPSASFPDPAIDGRSCAYPLVAEVEIGLMYCFPAAKAGDIPTVEEQWEAARLQAAGMAALRRAIECCYRKAGEFALGTYTAVGPDGGFVGGTWTVFFTGWQTNG